MKAESEELQGNADILQAAKAAEFIRLREAARYLRKPRRSKTELETQIRKTLIKKILEVAAPADEIFAHGGSD